MILHNTNVFVLRQNCFLIVDVSLGCATLSAKLVNGPSKGKRSNLKSSFKFVCIRFHHIYVYQIYSIFVSYNATYLEFIIIKLICSTKKHLLHLVSKPESEIEHLKT